MKWVSVVSSHGDMFGGVSDSTVISVTSLFHSVFQSFSVVGKRLFYIIRRRSNLCQLHYIKELFHLSSLDSNNNSDQFIQYRISELFGLLYTLEFGGYREALLLGRGVLHKDSSQFYPRSNIPARCIENLIHHSFPARSFQFKSPYSCSNPNSIQELSSPIYTLN